MLFEVVSLHIDPRYVADHYNGLTITGLTNNFRRVDLDNDVNKVSHCRIDDPTRPGELIVVTPVNIATAIFLCAVGTKKELLVSAAR